MVVSIFFSLKYANFAPFFPKKTFVGFTIVLFYQVMENFFKKNVNIWMCNFMHVVCFNISSCMCYCSLLSLD